MDDTSMQVQLLFSGRNLKDMDMFSKSDPYVKVYVQTHFHGNLDLIGRTQTQNNTVNPNWKQHIAAQYFFQMKQPMRIQVYDEDDSKHSDFIGKAESTLGAVMGAQHQTLLIDIKDEKAKTTGKIIIRGETIENSSHSLKMKWRGMKIANVDSMFDFWDKSDPYLKFLKIRSDNTLVQVKKTQILMNNQQPSWKQISIPSNKLVMGNNSQSKFKIQCWDYEDKQSKHQFIGEIFLSLDQLKNAHTPAQFNIVNPKIKKPGKLLLQYVQLIPTPSFVDYLKSGLQLNLITAIDFTGSNGSPTQPNSLHYISKPPTQYQQVLDGIWQIIENYDYDKRIPSFGFGAKPHFPNLNQNTANHCFPLNGNYQNPQIQGFKNLMECYMQAVSHMEFAGPTYFAPLLKQSFQVAKGLQKSYSYQILLILTDGAIHDMPLTKDIIVQNNHLPMSIIIVGIGNADFGDMQKLDGDSGLFSTKGKKCDRDIVQFVPYNKFGGNSSLLANQLLKQIPSQVVQYMMQAGKSPKVIPRNNMSDQAPGKQPLNAPQVVFNQFK